jgi:hypothetical protein
VLELVVVLVVLALLGALAAPGLRSVVTRSSNDVLQASHAGILRQTLATYTLESGNITWAQALQAAVSASSVSTAGAFLLSSPGEGTRGWELRPVTAGGLSSKSQLSYVEYVDMAADGATSAPQAGVTIASIGSGEQICYGVVSTTVSPATWCLPAAGGEDASTGRVLDRTAVTGGSDGGVPPTSPTTAPPTTTSTTTTVPAPVPDVTPADVGVTPWNSRLVVEWAASTSPTAVPITGYRVFINGVQQCEVAVGVFTCTVTGLSNGSSYQVTVAAYNVNGSGTPSSSVTATPIDVPDAVLSLTATGAGNGGAITLSWDAPATGATGYRIYRAPATTMAFTLLATQSGTTRNDTPPDAARYCYKVAGYTTTGEGVMSASVCASTWHDGIVFGIGSLNGTTAYTNPATSGLVTVTATSTYSTSVPARVFSRNSDAWSSASTGGQYLQMDLGATRRVTPTRIWVRWANATLAGYVSGSVDGTNWTTLANSATSPGVDVQQTLDATLSGSTAYRYFRFGRPTTYSGWFTINEIELWGVTTDSAPAAPTSFTATSSTGKVLLAWTAPSGDISGYRIERAPQSTMAFSTLAGVTAVRYEDLPADGATYCYRVVAVSLAGESAPTPSACGEKWVDTYIPQAFVYDLGTANGTTSYTNPGTNGTITMSASSSYGGRPPTAATDRNASSFWSGTSGSPNYLQIDLGATRRLTPSRVWVRWGNPTTAAYVSASVDGVTWTTLAAPTVSGPLDQVLTFDTTISSSTAYRYFRFGRSSSYTGWFTVLEVELWGVAS